MSDEANEAEWRRRYAEARALAREIHGHTRCQCFERRLPPSHWLFRDAALGERESVCEAEKALEEE